MMFNTTAVTDRSTGVKVSPLACRMAWKAKNRKVNTSSKERVRT